MYKYGKEDLQEYMHIIWNARFELNNLEKGETTNREKGVLGKKGWEPLLKEIA